MPAGRARGAEGGGAAGRATGCAGRAGRAGALGAAGRTEPSGRAGLSGEPLAPAACWGRGVRSIRLSGWFAGSPDSLITISHGQTHK